MTYYQVVLLSFTICVPALLAWIRFRNIERSFYPFVFFIWTGLINEIVSLISSYMGSSTIFNNNVYILTEALLILWQFKEWNFFSGFRKGFYILGGGVVIVWLVEHGNRHGVLNVNLNFRLLYSLMIVLMSIHLNNGLIFTSRRSLIKNPIFLICNSFTIYFTYKILVEVFWIYGLNSTKAFRMDVYLLMMWINVLTNIIYAIAILCIPPKPRFIGL